jgi:hypothetical protein
MFGASLTRGARVTQPAADGGDVADAVGVECLLRVDGRRRRGGAEPMPRSEVYREPLLSARDRRGDERNAAGQECEAVHSIRGEVEGIWRS